MNNLETSLFVFISMNEFMSDATANLEVKMLRRYSNCFAIIDIFAEIIYLEVEVTLVVFEIICCKVGVALAAISEMIAAVEYNGASTRPGQPGEAKFNAQTI